MLSQRCDSPTHSSHTHFNKDISPYSKFNLIWHLFTISIFSLGLQRIPYLRMSSIIDRSNAIALTTKGKFFVDFLE